MKRLLIVFLVLLLTSCSVPEIYDDNISRTSINSYTNVENISNEITTSDLNDPNETSNNETSSEELLPDYDDEDEWNGTVIWE